MNLIYNPHPNSKIKNIEIVTQLFNNFELKIEINLRYDIWFSILYSLLF